MDWIDLIDLCFAVAGLTIAIIGVILASSTHSLDRWYKNVFIVFFSFLTAYVLSDLISQLSLLFFGEDCALLTKLAIFMESLFPSLLIPMLTMLLLKASHEDIKKSPLMKLVTAVWGVYFVLLIYTQFSESIYYITPDNVYHRGPWYPILMTPTAILMLINLVALLRRWRKLARTTRIYLLIYLTVPLAAMLIQMFVYGLLLNVVATTITALILLISVQNEQVKQSLRLKEELIQRRLETMTLQMRPHFIYNTLMSIYYLCEQDPESAQNTILDFSTYLQKNFTAVTREDTIPFRDELAHTKAYLSVEQVRFEDHLSVELDTPHTQFRLPPLTLQPIVENAVKHGVDPELEPLQIRVQTRELPNGCEILVEDTGPGYAPTDDDEPHIALDNIQKRLELMCMGTLEISAREGGGTIVRIVVPS